MATKKGGRVAAARRDATGRLHLVVHRDPGTGQEHVALRAPVFREAWQNEVATGAANTAHGVLCGEPSAAGAVELARTAMAATSRLIDGLFARAPKGSVACKAGCDHCCHQVVGVTTPEALAIFAHLKETRSEDELARLTRHVVALDDVSRGLSSAERFSPDHPCVFLDAGRCTIYEVRPLACRGMNSLDAGECESRLRDPEARAAFLASGSGGRSFMEPIRAFHAVSAGLQLALSEIYGLDMLPLELTRVMRRLLEDPASLPDEWAAGKAPFASARSHDKSDDPTMRELSGALRAPTSKR
ncbi:MAG TPA: YkgJ family cysteine cluster protein [Polyangiaceae bacterium]|nr:YkgJ family cysteine cluster protein [Polyangiaceae bacterium]